MDSEHKYKQISHGRVPKEDVDKFKDMYSKGKKIEEISQATGWSGVTIRNYVHEGKPKREYKRQYVNHITGERYHTRETEQVSSLRAELSTKKGEIKEVDKKLTQAKDKLDKAEREIIQLKAELKTHKKNAIDDREKIDKFRNKLNDTERELSDKLREYEMIMTKIKSEGYPTKNLTRKNYNDLIKKMQNDGFPELFRAGNQGEKDVYRPLTHYVS